MRLGNLLINEELVLIAVAVMAGLLIVLLTMTIILLVKIT